MIALIATTAALLLKTSEINWRCLINKNKHLLDKTKLYLLQ